MSGGMQVCFHIRVGILSVQTVVLLLVLLVQRMVMRVLMQRRYRLQLHVGENLLAAADVRSADGRCVEWLLLLQVVLLLLMMLMMLVMLVHGLMTLGTRHRQSI